MSAVAFNRSLYGRLLANTLPHVIHTDKENESCIAELRGSLESRQPLI